MATTWRKPYIVLTRSPGKWVEGHYYPEKTGLAHNVMMTIQSPSVGDRNAIDALPMGRRTSRYIKIYTDERLNAVSQEPKGSPGDLILYDTRMFLIIGETIFQNMQTSVSHYRYFAAEVIEQSGTIWDDGETIWDRAQTIWDDGGEKVP